MTDGENLKYYSFESPVGWLTAREENGRIKGLCFGRSHLSGKPAGVLAELEKQLSQYFSGERKTFDLPLSPDGTQFRKKVWNELLKIPYGETRSYKEIAIAVGNEKACRAVGTANNRNPIAILIPCHRVIGSDGSLTGYAGGIEVKKFLLELERRGK